MTFQILYDLRGGQAWLRAHEHRNLWGKRLTDYYFLDNDHVVMVFRPAEDPRWRPWEEVRKRMILGERTAV